MELQHAESRKCRENVFKHKERNDNVHQRVDFLELESRDLHNDISDEAESKTVGDGIEEGHSNNGEEAGNSNLDIAPVDVLERSAHHNADYNENRSGGCAGNKTHDGRKEQTEQEAKTGDGGGQTGSAASGDTGGGLDIGGNGGSTHDSAR